MPLRKEVILKGWDINDWAASRKFGEYEIAVEFCLADNCVGIYDKRFELLEPKRRCYTMHEVRKAIRYYITKYKL